MLCNSEDCSIIFKWLWLLLFSLSHWFNPGQSSVILLSGIHNMLKGQFFFLLEASLITLYKLTPTPHSQPPQPAALCFL